MTTTTTDALRAARSDQRLPGIVRRSTGVSTAVRHGEPALTGIYTVATLRPTRTGTSQA